MAAKRKIGEILVEKGFIDETQLSEALAAQQADRQGTGKIGQFLVSEGKVTPEQVTEAFSEQSGIKIVTEEDLKKLDPAVLGEFPIALAKKFKALPLYADSDLHVVITDFDMLLFNQLFMIYRKNVVSLLVSPAKINDMINQAYSSVDNKEEALNAEEFGKMADEDDTIPDLIDSNDDAPIIKFVNNTIAKAVKEKASDIHFESYEDEVIVRFRKDGKLSIVQRVPKAAQAGLMKLLRMSTGLLYSQYRQVLSRLNIARRYKLTKVSGSHTSLDAHS